MRNLFLYGCVSYKNIKGGILITTVLDIIRYWI